MDIALNLECPDSDLEVLEITLDCPGQKDAAFGHKNTCIPLTTKLLLAIIDLSQTRS